MDKSNVEKWHDGSVVDEWIKSKAYRKFKAYHPYLTFSDSLNNCFVEPNGKQGKELNPDTEALFDIGREVYKRLPDGYTKEDFDQAYSSHWEFIDNLRQTFQKMESDGKIKGVNEAGEVIAPLWSDLADNQVLDLAWQLFPKMKLGADSVPVQMLAEAFLFHAFYEIDSAIIGSYLDGREAIAAAIAATNALANAVAIESGNDRLQEARREMAYRAALAKIAKDPKQTAKRDIFSCWQVWQEEPDRYDGKADFARKMLDRVKEKCNCMEGKCKCLKSHDVVKRWCGEWENSNFSS